MRSPGAAALWLICLLSLLVAAPAQAQDEPCQGPIELVNGSFEDPASVGGFEILDAQNVPGWDTTASDQGIEIWQDGYLGVPAIDGEQFAELNANVPSELLQQQPTTPGALVAYRVFHRGREGVDTMEVRIGPPDGPPDFVRSVQTGKNAWVQVAGTYLVPPGQTSTRFGFAAIETATGNLSIGNFLDGVEFSSSTCALTVTKALRPRGDRGRFNLFVDGVVRARRVGHGGTTGTLPIPAGTALIRERAARGTRLSDYRSSIGCVHADGTVARVVRSRSLELEFEPNDHVHCLVANVQGPAGTSRPAHPAAAASSCPGAACLAGGPGAASATGRDFSAQDRERAERRVGTAGSLPDCGPLAWPGRRDGPAGLRPDARNADVDAGSRSAVPPRPPVLGGAPAGEREAAYFRADRARRSPSGPSS
jgi:hypothetical protein